MNGATEHVRPASVYDALVALDVALNECGWTRHTWFDLATGRVDLIGAIGMACVGRPQAALHLRNPLVVCDELVRDVVYALCDALPGPRELETLLAFNDSAGHRGVGDVHALVALARVNTARAAIEPVPTFTNTLAGVS